MPLTVKPIKVENIYIGKTKILFYFYFFSFQTTDLPQQINKTGELIKKMYIYFQLVNYICVQNCIFQVDCISVIL